MSGVSCTYSALGTAGTTPDYFFPFDVDLVCANALPATLLEFELYLPSRRIVEALEATDLLVCFVLAIILTPFIISMTELYNI